MISRVDPGKGYSGVFRAVGDGCIAGVGLVVFDIAFAN